MNQDIYVIVAVCILIIKCDGKRHDSFYVNKEPNKFMIKATDDYAQVTEDTSVLKQKVSTAMNNTKATRWGAQGMPFSILYLGSKSRRQKNLKKTDDIKVKHKQYSTLPQFYSYSYKKARTY